MTVLQALDRYYGRMAARGEAEAPGYSREKIGFAIVLSADGEPIQTLDLRQAAGRRMIPRLLEVPAAVRRTVAILGHADHGREGGRGDRERPLAIPTSGLKTPAGAQ